ncbi:CYTH domain-containing protein [[Clostridium] polysaccharolyticum]|uniref:Adenylate cyclase n=1 Tax=[Clostridium] polysaccharolyticum TaxID=29364 RepID=A0A1H9ZRV3_9FIRM|nr:CYTH domain-containing protein [[Clostridium] polysaccharolyticum]SES84448.1 adenylate cyclase [[Clostridium] polysaccharolyticum]
MEIERKFLVKQLPDQLEQYQCKIIEQGYLSHNPTLRIRKSNENYLLTYKSKFGIGQDENRTAKVENEVEVPLNEESFLHLKAKTDNHMIVKKRYLIPLEEGLTAELDIFKEQLEGLRLVEVEFASEEAANRFVPPVWFGKDVSLDRRYTNGYLSTVDSYNF